ncbi:hypothetical protein M430DRAFT_137696 [Amorphotheca resinae ATCC 22711]|uniref:Store-operated calcium entry-associated regulatory factor n=1 Tax=Amorphotheca resinae ATCC 22711 TaxID=857342 RepID=A0A2T3B6P7_AMORE|nr:hypothetical protein M430DRAFT_137696 [Amorphotheca resinae ATCC 22711]PSS22447.1 hypothetical protein M430DRAFT_137696 [Amorphotheca resinae ATCC 22711]
MHLPLLPTLLGLLALTGSSSAGRNPRIPKDAILLSNVKSLTLRADAKTAHRRLPAIPQLKCKGPGCKYYKVDVMRCTNQGSDYDDEDVQWSCVASLPPEFKLGSTDVMCEGYDSADDPRVLKGSCGVEYRLLLTEKGEERYGSGDWFSSSPSGEAWAGYLFALVFLAVLAWILYSMFVGYRNNVQRRPAPRGGRWGGGWGGDDNDDPPPPYPGTSPYPGKTYRGGAGNAGQGGWGPGFLAGALGGAAAGYLAGSRRGGRQMQPEVPRGGGWGGGYDGGGFTRTGSSGSSSSSGSSARYESTGFGSTIRR